ncbi:uncharacterized protein LOC132536963 [Erinaceus europaeus]|uniref:Uncharacterized protein LOC132536963 n=1 Tax=Erinaceus europaeus TaxID=9365 RepID=A0ABM3X0R1_ERIEU|nr:uncharacterized protein LOC132536963 [Erinaceus europaeus]
MYPHLGKIPIRTRTWLHSRVSLVVSVCRCEASPASWSPQNINNEWRPCGPDLRISQISEDNLATYALWPSLLLVKRSPKASALSSQDCFTVSGTFISGPLCGFCPTPARRSRLSAAWHGALGAGSLHAARLLGAGQQTWQGHGAGLRQPILASTLGHLGPRLLHGWPAHPRAMKSGQIPDDLETAGSLPKLGPLAEISSLGLKTDKLEYAEIHPEIATYNS